MVTLMTLFFGNMINTVTIGFVWWLVYLLVGSDYKKVLSLGLVYTQTRASFFTYWFLCCRILGEVGLNYVELLPEIVPLFIKSLQDDTPAVVRQVIASASALFPSTLHKFALQVAPLFLSVFVLHFVSKSLLIWLPLALFFWVLGFAF